MRDAGLLEDVLGTSKGVAWIGRQEEQIDLLGTHVVPVHLGGFASAVLRSLSIVDRKTSSSNDLRQSLITS